jgi:hypothetical protein
VTVVDVSENPATWPLALIAVGSVVSYPTNPSEPRLMTKCRRPSGGSSQRGRDKSNNMIFSVADSHSIRVGTPASPIPD